MCIQPFFLFQVFTENLPGIFNSILIYKGSTLQLALDSARFEFAGTDHLPNDV